MSNQIKKVTLSEKDTESGLASRLSQINYKEYPECIFAMLAAFLPDSEGDDLRRVAGKVVFRSEDKDGNTYRNGLLHSFHDNPALVHGKHKEWYVDGLLHREGDKPAVVIDGVAERWYKHGKSHRDGDKPAHIAENYQEWWVDGKRHRDGDLPAIIDGNRMSWYSYGRINREGDLPSVEDRDLHLYMWFKNGLRHRDGDRPAVIEGAIHEYWENDILIRVEEGDESEDDNEDY